jgi:hypothetical protein
MRSELAVELRDAVGEAKLRAGGGNGLDARIVAIRVDSPGLHLCPLRDIPLSLFAKRQIQPDHANRNLLTDSWTTAKCAEPNAKSSTFCGTVMHFGNGFDRLCRLLDLHNKKWNSPTTGVRLYRLRNFQHPNKSSAEL